MTNIYRSGYIGVGLPGTKLFLSFFIFFPPGIRELIIKSQIFL